MINQNQWVNVDVRGNVIGNRPGTGGPLIDIMPAARDIRPSTDKALKSARKAGNDLLDKGKEILGGAIGAASNVVIPGSGAVLGAIGVGGAPSLIEQLQEWIKESGIFQRLALAILAFVFIAVALTMLGRNSIVGNVAQVVKGKL